MNLWKKKRSDEAILQDMASNQLLDRKVVVFAFGDPETHSFRCVVCPRGDRAGLSLKFVASALLQFFDAKPFETVFPLLF